jgi:hypothetical protein
LNVGARYGNRAQDGALRVQGLDVAIERIS